MCRFLSWDFEYRLDCPVDKVSRTVRAQSFPHPGGHFLEVVGCDAALDVEKLSCRKECRDALEHGDFWRELEVTSVD
jgi:hypothetical protein